MDFYEELGVSRFASLDEIRGAYRRRARLFHPDRYPNAELRAIAEAEMRRVNDIAVILTHPQERLRYDRTLTAEGVAADTNQNRSFRAAHSPLRSEFKVALLLVAGAAASLTCILALRVEPASATATPVAAANPAHTALVHSAKPERKPSRVPLSPMEGKRMVETAEASLPPIQADIAWQNLIPLLPPFQFARADKPVKAPAPAPPNSESPSDSVGGLHIDSADTPASLPSDEIRPAHRNSGLVGLWRYTRSAQRPALTGVFAAQEVEVGITSQSGIIYGYYEGRYVSPQGPVSREASFQFSGTAEKESARTTWSSPDGSRGEIRLHMASEDSLEMVWIASHPGRRGQLASGKIILARVE
jgi:hypothetical protein